MQDTLSDMLVRIKNAQHMKHGDVCVVDSGLNRKVCDVLVDEGYIENYAPLKEAGKPALRIVLKYYLGNPVISSMKRVSKSSRRVYKKATQIPRIVDGFGVLVISTSKGVMSHLKAKKNNIGGELLFWVN